MNVDETVISFFEENCWSSSNCLEEKTVNNAIDMSDVLKKLYDFPVDISNNQLDVLETEAEKENECVMETADFIIDDSNISKSVTSTITTPIWIMISKKVQINNTIKSVDKQMLDSLKLTDEYKLTKLKSIDDMTKHNNISNVRNVPNILRGPKIISKSNASSPIPFESENNSLGTNNLLENDIFEKDQNSSIKKSHRKRKQIHNPLVIQEDSTNMAVDTKLNYSDKFMKKNKFDSKKEKFENYQDETTFRNKISFTPTEEGSVQCNGITTNVSTCTNEQTKDQMTDLNLSSKFDEFYKEHFHEDYTDHLDILADTLKEYQDLNDSYDHKCYDKDSNYTLNSTGTECSNFQFEESPKYDKEYNEYPWDNTDTIENNYLSDNDDYLNNNNNFLAFSKDLEFAHFSSNNCNLRKASIHNLCNNNCSSDYLNESSDDEFCLKTLSYNDLQNSFTKDEARHLDTILLEEKKCEVNLENNLNELNSSKINFKLTDDTKNITPISLSNGLEHTNTIKQDESKQESDQCDVLLSTDLSTEISSDHPENTEPDDINLPKEECLLIQKNIKKEAVVPCDYRVEEKYKKRGDKQPLQMESDESMETDEDLNKRSKSKMLIETLQCLLCALTFTSKRTLALHLAGAHGGMYVILCERCGRLFNKKCLFNRHFIHCGCVKLPFGCQKCNKTYRHKSSLLHHLKVVHQIEHKRDTTKLYKCNVCSKVYRKCGAFEKHLGMHIAF